MRLTLILNETVNRKVDLLMMKLSELFLKVDAIQQMKNSFLIPRLWECLLELAEELPDPLHGFRIFISIDY